MEPSAPGYRLTKHVISRYIDRVKPGLTETQAAKEIMALIDSSEITERPPAWKSVSPDETEKSFYAEPSDGICFVIKNHSVITVVNRGWKPKYARKAKNSRRKHRPSRKLNLTHKRRRKADLSADDWTYTE